MGEASELAPVPEQPQQIGMQLISILIRRRELSGSRELIPADDAIAKQLVYDALYAVVGQENPR